MVQYSQSCDTVLVSIHCLVYNHGPYIRKCLEGFIMQNTSRSPLSMGKAINGNLFLQNFYDQINKRPKLEYCLNH